MKNKLSVVVFLINAITGLVWFVNGQLLARFDSSQKSIFFQTLGIAWFVMCCFLAFYASIDGNFSSVKSVADKKSLETKE